MLVDKDDAAPEWLDSPAELFGKHDGRSSETDSALRSQRNRKSHCAAKEVIPTQVTRLLCTILIFF